MSRLPPLIIVHRGRMRLARPVVAQACFFYEGDVIFVNDAIEGAEQNLRCVHIRDLAAATAPIADVYRHVSVNDENYERFCIERWFMIKALAERNGLESFVVMDSDVFIYPGIGGVVKRMSEQSFTSWTHFCHLTASSLGDFCRYVVDLYSDSDRFDAFVKDVSLRSQGRNHVSDMDLFEEFARLSGGLSMNGAFQSLGIDPNIGILHGCVGDGGRKKIGWIEGHPVAFQEGTQLPIPFYALHLQGRSKPFWPQFRSSPLQAEPALLQGIPEPEAI